jgi:alpha-beta hydrolase superfamily lysophospholipase
MPNDVHAEVLAADNARAVVVVAHGLNQRVSALRSLGEALRERGATIVPLRFRGHRLDREEDAATFDAWRSLTWRDWLADWEETTERAHTLAIREGVPLAFLGYSLGALVQTYALAFGTGAPAPYTRQLLLAPAIRVRAYTRTARVFRGLGGRFLIPSVTPVAIRSHGATSVAAFEALFHYESSLDAIPDPARLRIPTLVLIDRRDELASAARLHEWIDRHALGSEWEVEPIPRPAPAKPLTYRHYVTDESALGPDSFRMLVARIATHLLGER